MELCWYSKKRRVENNLACIVLLICAVFMLRYLVFNGVVRMVISGEIDSFIVLILWAWQLVFVFWMVNAGVLIHLVFTDRAYDAMEEGVCVRNLKKVWKYFWDEISEIAVCDVHHATRSYAHDKVIRIVIGQEKNGPMNPKCSCNIVNGVEHWREASYSLRHCRKIILIEYSEERLKHIEEVYKRKIKDYRTKCWNLY